MLALSLLWGHIQRRAEYGAAQRADASHIHQLHHTEVNENRLAQLRTGGLLFIEQDIRRLNITMHHAMLMGIVNSTADGVKEMDNVGCRWEVSCVRGCTNILSQSRSVNIVHDHVGQTAIVFRIRRGLEVMNLHNI